MYNNIIEYQKKYLSKLFDTVETDFGYFTQSTDLEYINSNSIIVTEVTADTVASVCALLVSNIHTTKIQFPRLSLEFGDEDDCLYLIKYDNQKLSINPKVSIEVVDSTNYDSFIKLSNELQIQEYGSLYKSDANSEYLNQSVYKMYMVKVEDAYVGEFIFMEELQAVESIIVSQDYQRQGIGIAILELITAMHGSIYLSADNSSIGFYKKINSQIIDEYHVRNLYGNARNLLTYITYAYNPQVIKSVLK